MRKPSFFALAAAAGLMLAPAAAAEEQVAPAKAPLQFVQEYEPSPAIFRIADEDTTIYLLGTNHALPPGFRWRSAQVDAAIEEADELVLETAEGSPEDVRATARVKELVTNSIGKQPPLLMRVPEEKRAGLKKAIEKGDVPEPILDLMPTWLAAFGIAKSAIEEGGQDFGLGVEDVLQEEFDGAGKPIGSIEDPLPIMQALHGMPEEAQRRLLAEAVEFEDATEQEEESADPLYFEHQWAQGNLDALAEELTEEIVGPELYEILITRRNKAWVGWFAERLERPGTVLVAVGAGHLAGPDAVQKMLAEAGIKAERID